MHGFYTVVVELDGVEVEAPAFAFEVEMALIQTRSAAILYDGELEFTPSATNVLSYSTVNPYCYRWRESALVRDNEDGEFNFVLNSS